MFYAMPNKGWEMKTLIIILLFVSLVGCSSLNRVEKIDNQSLTIGKSKKMDVVNQIGLPAKVKKIIEFEYWYYSGREEFKHIFIPIPITSNYADFVDVGSSIKLNFVPILTCVFDKEGVLQAAYKPQADKGE